MSRRIIVGIIAVGAVVTGCDGLSGPPAGELVPGIVEWRAEPGPTAAAAAGAVGSDEDVLRARIEAPDTVETGVPFDVVITTIGLSGCWFAGGEDVELGAGLAVVMPREVVEEGFCTGALKDLPRQVSLRFDAPGTGTIRVEGRRVVGYDHREGTDAAVERTVVVR